MQNVQNFQPQYAKKGNAFIWFGSIAIAAVCVILQGYGWIKGFEPWLAGVGITCALIVAVWSVWLTKFHDEPGEAYTTVSVICKIACVICMLLAAAVLFDVGRGLGVSQDVTDTRHVEETKKRESLQATIDNPRTGPKARFAATKALGAMKTDYLNKPKEDFDLTSPKALTAFGLDMGVFVLTFIAMFCAFVFFPTGKMVAAQAGINPNLVINDREETKLASVRTRVANAQIDSPSPKAAAGGEMSEGLTPDQVIEELNKKHPNTPKGSTVDIEKRTYESNGRTWSEWGVYTMPDAEAKTGSVGARGNMTINPPPQGVKVAESPSGAQNAGTRAGTQDANVGTRAGTQTPIELLRQVLKEMAKPGHFFFSAEKRRNHILIRQVVSRNQKEESIASHTMDLEFLQFAQEVIDDQRRYGAFVDVVREDLLGAGFDLEGGTR